MSASRLRFRAWHNNKMHSAVGLFPSGESFFSYYNPDRCINGGAIMQSTGLLDQDGVEIFEGDILEMDFKVAGDTRHCVYWSYDTARFCPELIMQSYTDNAVVIGNSYENPELIE